ncbi:MAG: competence/damage-inducible protein A [Cellulosilyticaceae bacterium]
MKAEIIAIGDEVVKGFISNTNAAYIAKRMLDVGLETFYHSAVCDEKLAIIDAIEIALKRSEIIFCIGGLGPTDDDLTKEVVCEMLGKKMIFYNEYYEEIQEYFKKTGRSTPENNKKQALFPKDAIILENDYGTAPGCILNTEENKIIILLPGPPTELIPMLENKVIPYLKNKQNLYIKTIDLVVYDIGESHLADKLGNHLGISAQLTVATYVRNSEIIVRICARGTTQEIADKIADEKNKNISECLKEHTIGYNDSEIEDNIVKYLIQNNYKIATAESCTGGLLVGTLVNCPGISSMLSESIVTYSNEAKQKYLGVRAETLQKYGAVSAQTAKEMAIGIQKQANANIGLATTGIAGPDGGSDEKPVGTVYIGIAIDNQVYTYLLTLKGTREEIRTQTVKNVLCKLYRHLYKQPM